MKRLFSLLLIAVMLLTLCACGGKENTKTEEPKTFRVGFGRVDVTPTGSVSLDGYDPRASEGVLNPVMATCVAITDAENNTILLYTVDMCNSEKQTVKTLRERLTKSTGVPEDNITVSATHTHSSPEEPYPASYIDQLVQAGEEAMKDRAPATITAGSYDVPHMNFVRHYITKDGTYYGDNFGKTGSGLLRPTTEADGNMRLIRFIREGDKKDVLMVNWQVHPKTASTNNTAEGRLTRNLLSSDFIGFARDYVEANADVLMAYYTGAAGNLNPESKLAAENQLAPRGGQPYGEQFGSHVVEALKALQPLQTGNVGSKKTLLGETAGGYSLHAYTVGGSLGFATVPAEIFDTTGKQIREGSPTEITFVLTCANGRHTYIPPAEVFDYSSSGVVPYEVRICKYPRGTAETLAQDLINMLTELQG